MHAIAAAIAGAAASAKIPAMACSDGRQATFGWIVAVMNASLAPLTCAVGRRVVYPCGCNGAVQYRSLLPSCDPCAARTQTHSGFALSFVWKRDG